MSHQVLNSLDQIIEETVSFQTLIDSEEWDELDIKLKARQKDLEKTLSSTIKDSEKPDIVSRLSKVANLDKHYQAQIKENKNRSTGNVLAFKKKHNAASAYSKTERHS